MAKSFSFRADQVGSLLRPDSLLKARRDHKSGDIDDKTLRAVEDASVDDVLRMQEAADISVVTDGEYRRTHFFVVGSEALEGFEPVTTEMIWRGPEGPVTVTNTSWRVTGQIRMKGRLAEDEANFLTSHTDRPVKICLPSPGFLVSQLGQPKKNESPYDGLSKVAEALGAIIRFEIEALFAQGVTYVQLDSPGYTKFLDEKQRTRLREAGRDPDAMLHEMLTADATTLRDIRKPDNCRIGMHLCRGNQSSRWLSEGSYEPIAEQLFNLLPVDRFLLEFDDERSGDFSALRLMPKNKELALGLITTKSGILEDRDRMLGRIDAASKFVDGERLAVSPQCGFASDAESGNHLAWDDQRRKLELVVEVAKKWWDDF
jgi:5-methyltetrahydropteroyltriglutamate--homocysteine methyltransferase